MKAAVFREHGPPEVLKIEDIENPPLQEGEVLVKVHAAAINPMDWRLRQANLAVKLIARYFKMSGPRIGADMAGVVEALGPNVTRLKVGDPVFGVARGACAEYVNARENRLSLKPKNVTFEEAAAVPVAGLTALQGLRDRGRIKKGDKVLVYGASGGIGHFAVQLARHYGAEVDGVCSTSNLGWVKDLGAHEVIDYTKEDFTKRGRTYDIIFDTVGYLTYFGCRPCLTETGVFLSANFINRPRNIVQLLIGSFLKHKRAKSFLTRSNREDLDFLSEHLASGALKPAIDRRYPLDQIVEAHRYAEAGHTKGKVVIEIRNG